VKLDYDLFVSCLASCVHYAESPLRRLSILLSRYHAQPVGLVCVTTSASAPRWFLSLPSPPSPRHLAHPAPLTSSGRAIHSTGPVDRGARKAAGALPLGPPPGRRSTPVAVRTTGRLEDFPIGNPWSRRTSDALITWASCHGHVRRPRLSLRTYQRSCHVTALHPVWWGARGAID